MEEKLQKEMVETFKLRFRAPNLLPQYAWKEMAMFTSYLKAHRNWTIKIWRKISFYEKIIEL